MLSLLFTICIISVSYTHLVGACHVRNAIPDYVQWEVAQEKNTEKY